MPQYRNISPDDLMVPDGHRWVKVPVGGVINVPNPDTYWQTGEQGEVALWEIADKATKAKGSATASTDETKGK